MHSSNPDLTSFMDVDKDDLLAAMKKLSKMIHSEKQFNIDDSHHQPDQHFSLPARMDSNPLQHTFAMPRNDSHSQADLIGNLRSLAQEISYMDNGDDYEQPVMKNSRPQVNYNVNITPKDYQYDYYETDRKTDRRTDAVNRLYEHENRKKEKLAALQFQRYKEELSTLRQKPEISLNSKIIAEQKNKAPIYERSIAVMKQREENINRMRRELEETRADLDSSITFQPDLSCTRRYHYERSRTPQEFTAHVYAWHQKKNEAIQKEQYENITRELSELTFKPKINTKSRCIAGKVNGPEPVESRLQKQKEHIEVKRQKLAEKEKPTFKPTLNEKSQSLAKQRKNQGDRSARLDKSANNSFVDTSLVLEDNTKKTPTHKRSLTPTLVAKGRPKQNKGNSGHSQVSPKFNEVNYTPAVDFLLRKFE